MQCSRRAALPDFSQIYEMSVVGFCALTARSERAGPLFFSSSVCLLGWCCCHVELMTTRVDVELDQAGALVSS